MAIKDPRELKNYCKQCGKLIERRFIKSKNSLEGPKNYLSRKYCDRICMRKAYLKSGITDQNLSETRSTARKMYSLYSENKKCELCGAENCRLEVHHKDHNPNNNTLENLQLLCSKCHRFIHRKTKEKCSVEWCKEPIRRNGYCEKHAQRYKKYGDPNISNRGYQNFIRYISADEYVRINKNEVPAFKKDNQNYD